MLYISVLYIDYLFDMLCISYTQKSELFWFLVGGNHRPNNTDSINGTNSIAKSMVSMFILSNSERNMLQIHQPGPDPAGLKQLKRQR